MTEEMATKEVNLFQSKLAQENRSPATMRAYMNDIRQFLGFLKDMNWSPWACTMRTIENYLTELRSKGFGSTTIHRKLSSIKGFLDIFVENGEMSANPIGLISRPKVQKKEPPVVTDEDGMRLIMHIDDSDILGARDKAMVYLLFETGIKDYELLAMSINDVKFLGDGLDMILVRGKQGERQIPIRRDIASALRNYLLFRSQAELPKDERQRLFVNKFGQPLNTRSVRRKIEVYRQKAGILNPITPSAFRNSCVLKVSQSNTDGETVKRMFGYKLPNKTKSIGVKTDDQKTDGASLGEVSDRNDEVGSCGLGRTNGATG